MVAITLTTTRDCLRFRKFNSPQILSLSTAFLSLLSSDSPSAALLRSAFVPALLGTDSKPRGQFEVQSADERLKSLFENPPNVVVPQGIVTQEQVQAAWEAGTGSGKSAIGESVYVGHALHQELENAVNDGEKEVVANLSMMVLATLTSELSQWIFTKTHGYRTYSSSDGASMHTNNTNASFSSLASLTSVLVKNKNRADVGDKAVIALFGADYELLSYTIGERQLVKRRFPSRRTPSLTPPLVYSLIHDTPSILDVTAHGPTLSRHTPPWKEGDNTGMYAVVSVLTVAGTANFHGVCTVGGGLETDSTQEFQVRFDAEGREKA